MCSAVRTVEHQFGLCLLDATVMEETTAWLVKIRNEEYGTSDFLGPYDSVVEALAIANTQATALALSRNTLNLEVTVHPMARPLAG